ncbi:PREDICTED: acylamino-acid-releasing enzyme-like [Priapulus caudatus]|uniref:Acylamino-acid-releasing enzyme-like n=1 Tax=Priapulus caudatus TaxID=37621 RepID=A0ABM1EWL2_PRICU|nr:PREDICTED: acylamino-acid-releasing enzyme-like [Priapulus caudatus]
MDPDCPQVVSEHRATTIAREVWNKLSPSGTYRAVLRKVAATGGATSDKQILEVWTHNKKVSNIDLQALDKHGPIYNDDNYFGSFEWSHGEGHILYIAEKKLPKYASFFDQKYGKVAEEGVDADETDAPLLVMS